MNLTRGIQNQGFTLIEMVLVIIIMGILAASVVMYTQGYSVKAQATADQATLATILKGYNMACAAGGASGGPAGGVTPFVTPGTPTYTDINSWAGHILDSNTTTYPPGLTVSFPTCANLSSVNKVTVKDMKLTGYCSGPAAPDWQCTAASSVGSGTTFGAY